MFKKKDYMIEVLKLQNKINDALDIISDEMKEIINPKTNEKIIILDFNSIYKLVKTLGDESDKD